MTTKTKAKTPTKVPPPVMVPLNEINEAPYNPRVMPPEMMQALKASIRRHGMVVNLVVQRAGMVLVGGHQRLRAMREVATEDGTETPSELPCVVLDLNDSEAKQLNVSLNKIEGDFDPYKLGEMFASIRDELTYADVEATGFTMQEVDQAVLLVQPFEDQIRYLEEDDGLDVGAFAKSITLTVEFDTVETRDKAKLALREAAERQGCKAGKIIADAIHAWTLSHPSKSKTKPKTKSKKQAA